MNPTTPPTTHEVEHSDDSASPTPTASNSRDATHPPESDVQSLPDDDDEEPALDTELPLSLSLPRGTLTVLPLLPWVPISMRYNGRPRTITALAREYLKTLSFSVRPPPPPSSYTAGADRRRQRTLDACKLCAAGFLGRERKYGLLEYSRGRWASPMALRVQLRCERAHAPAAPGVDVVREVRREEFVAGAYPEDGWAYLVESVEALELVIDPNYD